MPQPTTTVYWHIIEVHWSDAQQTTNLLRNLNLPITLDASVSLSDTRGMYRLLSASLTPGAGTLIRITLGELASVQTTTDIEEILDTTNDEFVNALVRETQGALEAAIREHLVWLYFIE